MAEFELIIPNTTFKPSWINFVETVRSNYDFTIYDTILVNFNNRSFLDTGCLVMLACLIEEINNRKKELEFVYSGGTLALNNHLNNIKFKEYWRPEFDRDRYTSSNNSTTLCLWQISSDMIDSYSQQAQLFYKRQFFQHLDLQPLSSTLVEIFNNIFNHANSNIRGYVLTQYFPKMHTMSIAVCDFGKGIPTSINNYRSSIGLELYNPESQAIRMSLEAGISSKSVPQNAGLGLNNVLTFSENTNGLMSVYSNSGKLTKNFGYEFVLNKLKNSFNGTLIIVDFDTRLFEKFDIEDEIYDFK